MKTSKEIYESIEVGKELTQEQRELFSSTLEYRDLLAKGKVRLLPLVHSSEASVINTYKNKEGNTYYKVNITGIRFDDCEFNSLVTLLTNVYLGKNVLLRDIIFNNIFKRNDCEDYIFDQSKKFGGIIALYKNLKKFYKEFFNILSEAFIDGIRTYKNFNSNGYEKLKTITFGIRSALKAILKIAIDNSVNVSGIELISFKRELEKLSDPSNYMEFKDIIAGVKEGTILPNDVDKFKEPNFYKGVYQYGEPFLDIKNISSEKGFEILNIKGYASSPNHDILKIPMSKEEAKEFINNLRMIYLDDTTKELFIKPRNIEGKINVSGSLGDKVNAIKKVFDLYINLKKHIVVKDLQGNYTPDYEILKDNFRVIFFKVKSIIAANYCSQDKDSLEKKILNNYIIESFKNEELA